MRKLTSKDIMWFVQTIRYIPTRVDKIEASIPGSSIEWSHEDGMNTGGLTAPTTYLIVPLNG